ncbi:hypothetical protein GCM10027047_01550 [Rhodococcus aerolatus]
MIHVVIGPPAAGKSTWVRQHAQPTDVVIDFDLLALALSAPDPDRHPHSHPGTVRRVTHAARDAAIEAAFRLTACDVYLIHSTPSASRLDSYRRRGAQVHTVDPGRDVVLARCRAERPAQMLRVAQEWYANGGPPPDDGRRVHVRPTRTARPTQRRQGRRTGDTRTTTQRGYGAAHQRRRRELLAALVDGEPCPRCGLPMHHGQVLQAGHSTDLADDPGAVADRLEHARCNLGAGASAQAARRAGAPEVSRPTATSRDW